jgi:nucleoside-diphosphate-sugar epimerase
MSANLEDNGYDSVGTDATRKKLTGADGAPQALVTGDLGFLGRHFRAELEARGYTVTGLDTKRTSTQDCTAYFRGAVNFGRWDLVVHAAAVVGGREKIDGSPLETAVNLAIDAEMFRWAAKAKPGRVVYFSSSAAYPVAYQTSTAPTWLCEADANGGLDLPPDQVYGWSKVVGEVLAERLRASGVPVTVVRPFSGYGEDQDDTYPFRAFVERARRREDPFPTWCGDCVRDFIHVDDVVAGTLALADADVTEPVNLCTGRATSFMELAKLVTAAAGYTPDSITADPGKPSGVAYRVGDPYRLNKHYVPAVTLEEGIARCFPQEES